MKLKPRIKKIIAMLLVALTINTSIFSAAVMPVQASTLPLASELVAALLSIFGYTYGYGTTLDGSNNTNQEMFAEMQAAWNAGESFEVDGTEVPDLRVASNFIDFVDWSYDTFSLYNSTDLANDYLAQLNEKSYKASGTLVTKTYLDALALIREHIANTAEDVLTTEIDTFFSAMTDDNAEISDFNSLSMYMGAIIAGIAVRSQVDAANTWTNSITSDYFTDDYKIFTGSYDGTEFQCLKTDKVKISTSDPYDFVFVFSEPVMFLLYQSGSQYKYQIIGSEPFSFTRNMYYNDGNSNMPVEYSVTSSKTVEGNLLYYKTYNFNYNITNLTCPINSFAITEAGFQTYVSANYETLFDTSTGTLLGSYESMNTSVTDALSAYGRRDVTRASIVELADTLDARASTAAGTDTAISELAAAISELAEALPEAGTSSGTGEYSSILDKILAAITAIAAAIWGFFSEPLAGIKSAIDIFPALLEELGSIVSGIPKSIWEYLEPTVTAIHEEVTAIVSQNTNPWDEDDTERSSDSVSLLNGFALLIFIIIELLKIFWHCLQFIVAIFEIQPSTAFLPDEVIMGLDYLKTLEITGIGLSVYDFLMGLVYILIVFSVVRVLRINIDRIHVPGHGIKKAN